jgi:single-stranded-DNA-specific exonuclease
VQAAQPAEVIILDHHLGAETLPQCCAVVNPNRQDEDSDLAHLCAASVVFLCLVEAGRQLRKMDQSGPDLMQMLDLVALATVADVAPLIGVNRAFVRQGLRIMAQRKRPGMTALADCANLQSPPSSYHLGFVLGPRINAGGRVGQADLGAKLLICDDPSHAQALAERLEELNQDRRDVEESVRLAAIDQASERGLEGPLVWAAGAGWHPGVVGIVAARLKESTNRPAIVIGFDGKSGKGSGRSVSGVDLGATIQKLVQEGMIEKGGGHKMAAGLSLTEAQLAPAMARLSDLLAKQGSAAGGAKDLQLDALLMASAASLELYEDLEKAGPFGSGAPTPRFAFSDMRLSFAKRVGDQHLKFRAQDPEGAALEGIAFNAFQTALGPALLAHGGKRFHLAGKLNLNIWNGRKSIQLVLDDAALA